LFTSSSYQTKQKKIRAGSHAPLFFQPKLIVNQPRNIYEKKSNAIADEVKHQHYHSGLENLFFSPADLAAQRKCSHRVAEEQHKVQLKENTATTTINPSTEKNFSSLSGGRPLNENERNFFEPRMGYDFSKVRLHTDNDAVHSAKDINALAYTYGNNIVFDENQFSLGNNDGQKLLMHELVHTVQQSSLPEAMVQRKSINYNIHDQLLDNYSDYSGQPRDTVTQHDPGYEQWLQMTRELTVKLQVLIDDATWPNIRKRVYPLESAAGIQRAKDRHAGSLPDLSGLGRLTSLDRFAASVKSIQSRWATLPTPDAKASAIGKAADDELVAAAVPPFRIVNKEPMAFKGYFSGTEWRFAISEQLVQGEVLTTTDAAEVANTAFHESRHAEQQFLAARYSADVNNLDEAALSVEQQIPKAIAAIAVTKKFDSGTNAAAKNMGRQMYQATVTDRTKNQSISNNDGWDDMADRRKEALSALQLLNTGATSKTIGEANAAFEALKSQIIVVEKKYALYRRIPYEADAHEVGDAAEQAFLGWPAAAIPTP